MTNHPIFLACRVAPVRIKDIQGQNCMNAINNSFKSLQYVYMKSSHH